MRKIVICVKNSMCLVDLVKYNFVHINLLEE